MADFPTTDIKLRVCSLCGQPTDEPHTEANCPRGGRVGVSEGMAKQDPLHKPDIVTQHVDIKELFDRMQEAADEHPDWVFLSSDGRGQAGWTAFNPNSGPSEGHRWVIGLSHLKRSMEKLDNRVLKRLLKTAKGRQQLLKKVLGRPGHPDITGERWTLSEAVVLINELVEPLKKAGWSVGLTGSVLWNGESQNDVDLIVYPLDSSEASHRELRKALGVCGMELQHDVEVVHKEWRKGNSTDCKHVEVWLTSMGRRVDIFILR